MSARSSSPRWLAAIRRYLIAIAGGNLLWEAGQLPLYTLWRTGTPGEIAVAVLHCTAGDLLIATGALIASLAVFGAPLWPEETALTVAVPTILMAMGYTAWSEYMNTEVRQSWTYMAWMPTLPWLDTGIAPLLQWAIVPAAALRFASTHMGNHQCTR